VLLARAASLPEVGGEAALYFNPNDPDELAAQIERLMADPLLRAELRRKGFEQAQRFSWKAAARATLQQFLGLAQDGPPA
jgi:glycosyltransferase involved in cell wall biosynthesis